MSVTKMDSSLSPPPFLTKTFEMVDDCHTDAIVSWSPSSSNSFVVWDLYQFSESVLPQFFEHNNFWSFVRQLNIYGFRKVDPNRWEFSHEEFRKGQPHRMKNIHRERPAASSNSKTKVPAKHPLAHMAWRGVGIYQEIPVCGESKIEQLESETKKMKLELNRLTSKHHAVYQQIKCMSERLQVMELNQQQIVAFIASSPCSPSLLSQYMDQAIVADHIRAQLTPLCNAWEARDVNRRKARRRPHSLNTDIHLCMTGSGVSVNSDNRQLQLQPQSGKRQAVSCETIQDTEMRMTTGTNNKRTSSNYQRGFNTDLCLHNQVDEGDHADATSVYQTADWSQGLSRASSSGVEGTEVKINICLKQPVIKVNGPALRMAKEHLETTFDLNLQPFPSPDIQEQGE